VVEWIDATLDALGRRRTGEVEQPHVRPWSTVLRVPTGERPVWFKANGPGSVYEAALLRLLGRLAPSYVVPPLAIDLDRGWSLSPDGGTTLRGLRADPVRWERILPMYARLQEQLSGRVGDLLAAGVPDLRPAAMPGHLDRLLDEPTLDADLAGQLRELRPAYVDWCAQLAADGVAVSLQHDDLHDANVFAGGDGYRIFDWGDACVAHPFGTLLVTLRSLAYQAGLAPDSAELARVRDAYLEAWTDGQDRATLRSSADLAMRVAKVGRALAWERALLGATAAEREEHSDAVIGWLTELLEPDAW
jgi:phosphotransferase family enzyme